jgi:DNA integrity scanning protein DisA with diadenylate cyclase activity
MTFEYVIDTVLNSSILILIFYACSAILVLSFAYLIEEEVRTVRDKKREQRELLERSERSIDAVIDEIYES